MNDPIFTSLFSPLMQLGLSSFDDWFEYLRWALIICGGTYAAILSMQWLIRTLHYSRARKDLIEEIEKTEKSLPSERCYANDPIVETGRTSDRGIPPVCGHTVVSMMDSDGVRLFRHHGKLVRSPYQDRLCRFCTETYTELFSTRCAECEQSIFPTDPIATAWIGASQPYTHLWCAKDIDLYCGLWGKGEHVSLHQIEPTQFAPGTRNMKSHHVHILQNRRRSSTR